MSCALRRRAPNDTSDDDAMMCIFWMGWVIWLLSLFLLYTDKVGKGHIF